jgi:uroporphyrinogen-III decarboxylase
MNSKERVRAALSRSEPDRVPLFEFSINNRIAKHILGRNELIWGAGETTKAAIEAEMTSKEEYEKFMSYCFISQVEAYSKAGFDMVTLVPTAFVTPYNFGLGNVAVREIYDVNIEYEGENQYRITSKDPNANGFWCTCKYCPESDTFQMYKDNILEKGEKEFERYVDFLESKSLADIPEQLKYGLDALDRAIHVNNNEYGLFLNGYADIEYPCFATYHSLFLLLMATNGDLVHRYMRATTDSVKTMLKIELEMGVDSIMGGNDWAYKSGPMMSPAFFDEFMAPYLKEIVDLTHCHKRYYIKHLDGNTNKILDSLIDICGIDAYHSIEPSAGMDIVDIKRRYGNKISVIGNIDCGDVLVHWTPGQIREEVKRIIRAVSPGGGHIFSSSNSIHAGVPIRNFLAYIDAARQYGVYPISSDM